MYPLSSVKNGGLSNASPHPLDTVASQMYRQRGERQPKGQL